MLSSGSKTTLGVAQASAEASNVAAANFMGEQLAQHPFYGVDNAGVASPPRYDSHLRRCQGMHSTQCVTDRALLLSARREVYECSVRPAHLLEVSATGTSFCRTSGKLVHL